MKNKKMSTKKFRELRQERNVLRQQRFFTFKAQRNLYAKQINSILP